jgi:hypothetical protein
MKRRLTFDGNPKELAHRDSGPTHVAILWSRRTGRAAVVAEDEHPFAFAKERGRRAA